MASSKPVSPGIRMIVGLGNVGARYERTRHNAGFWFVDRLAQAGAAPFRTERKFEAQMARVSLAGEDVWLLKPETFMNLSGQSVVAAALFYRLLPDQILVAHDEIDLPAGDVRMKQGGGVAGHNGLKDIRARLSNADFWRMRIGVGHPRELGLQQEVADFVLHPPRREEERAIDDAIERGLSIVDMAVAGEFMKAMTRLHTNGTPGTPTPEEKKPKGSAP